MNKNNINKKGLFAIYENKEYKLIKRGHEYYITSRDSSDLKKGFEYYVNVAGQINTDIFMKKVNQNDIQEAYKIEMWAKYKGEEFYIMGEDNGEVLITTSNCDIAKKLDFKFVEPFVYDKHVQIEDLDEIIEKQDKVYLD
ncbi:hypothetical protein QUF49_19705 [Fictibacillus sp. b24]|uniref:hypothetical protein n=1 Tax=Fictibacillus sp. b24 TaxID=3055863 RepID=UPI0025A0B890|nr:hypothetical protein [Fictibacillus sp. b24]MDM5318227.1 hypothetical protein [Fictibacillus sp. b24]